MDKLFVVIYSFFCLYCPGLFGQGSDYLVSDNSLAHFYVNVKNPIKVSLCSSKGNLYRLKAINGKMDTLNSSIYWTPYDINSLICIEKRNETVWNVIDTVQAKVLYINPEFLTVKVMPITFHAGLPQISRFTHFKVKDDGEYFHLHIDSIIWLVSLNAIIKNSGGNIIEHLLYSQSLSQSEKNTFKERIRQMREGETLTLSNIKVSGECWIFNGKYDIVTLPKDLYIKHWL